MADFADEVRVDSHETGIILFFDGDLVDSCQTYLGGDEITGPPLAIKLRWKDASTLYFDLERELSPGL